MSIKNQMWQVIEWKDNTDDTIVYRYPHQGKEIISGSSLTVRESQTAIFVHLGKIADIFSPGKYKLDTKNLPILTGLGSLFYQGRESRFKAEVYFINTKQFVNQKWGTSRPLIIKDADFGVVRIGAFGTYSFRVNDATTFMRELFGTNNSYVVDDINDYLRSMLVSTVTDTVTESKVSALEIYANLNEFGAMCATNVREKFISLGLDISNFVIENISFPESVEKAMDERASLGILSDKMGTYTQKRAADALGDAARNTGTVGTFMGIGVGQQAGSVMSNAFATNDTPKETSNKKVCPDCKKDINASAKFCPDCGHKFDVLGFCPECGASVAPTQKFCPECGKKLK
ncbi:MAG: SPFH domain-containing protein [Clostridia bacterium]